MLNSLLKEHVSKQQIRKELNGIFLKIKILE